MSIFCNSSNKYLPGERTQERLTQGLELRADAKVWEVAARKLSQDLVAAEGH